MTRSAKTTVVTAAFVMNVVHEQYRPFCFGLSPRKALVVSLFATTALSLVFLATGERTARAAQTIATISSAPAPAAPRLGNTTVFASKPGSPLLFTVGATGQSPLSFSATGLPSGLALSQTGTLTGTTPADGSYPIVVTVTNPAGKAQGTVTLLAQDTLAATPVMGWNSYDSFGSTVTETEVMQAAQAEQSILLPAGYRYVVVDYLWFDPEDTIDAYGAHAFSASWGPNSADFLAHVGLDYNGSSSYTTYGKIVAQFAESKSGSAGGYSSVGMYGWLQNPCVEYYIMEDSFEGLQKSSVTATIDGGTYYLIKQTTTGTAGANACSGSVSSWTQLLSVRSTARQCGTITVSDHFAAWANQGWSVGDVSSIHINVEVGGGTGSIQFPTASVSTNN